jgi:GNAT superfamily N-acetyltransferase
VSWVKFESETQIPAFIDAAVALHRPIFERLAARDRPAFFDAWLRRFNDSRAYLLAPDGPAEALVTVPRAPDVHAYRWQIRTLAFRDAAAGALALPADVDLARSFTVPCPGSPLASSPLAATTHEEIQLGYVGSLEDVPEESAIDELRLREAERGDLDAIIALLERSYDDLEDGPAGLDRQREELREIFAHDAGWCFVATPAATSEPIAMASYLMLHVPLSGVPAPLVGDLAVDPGHRRRGIARTLQRFAARRLRAAGCRWIFGNIDPGNAASRAQAEALRRTVWYRVIFFEPAC